MRRTFLAGVFGLLASVAYPQTSPLILTIDAKQSAQTIRNIGASGCWFSEGIGKYWPAEKREKIAELLFSRQLDASGNPKGIGLSAWRFNIGGGSAEQGDSSGIRDFRRRVECFLSPDGTYDWTKQSGYLWFTRKAKAYGVETLIAFSNSPPVFYNRNGRGFKTEKDYTANLRADKYEAYADFLAEVVKHFDRENLHFEYISPVNEPQWDWSNKPGQASQEGSPWSNAEIHRVVSALDKSLDRNKLRSKILLPEAGQLNYLYGGKQQAANQVRTFFGAGSALNLRKLSHVEPVIAGHSYFTDTGDSTLVGVRKQLADTVARYGVDYWQSEYSMLGDGFREGTPGRRSAMDCALFLAKVIHTDLTTGNAAAWQLWNSYEPGNAEFDTRYYLIALRPNREFTDGDFTVTRNLWALGNYSLFVRPGMRRVITGRNDGKTAEQAARDVMVSAFTGGAHKLTLVLVNYTGEDRHVQPEWKNLGHVRSVTTYTTSALAGDDLRSSGKLPFTGSLRLPARSVVTAVFD